MGRNLRFICAQPAVQYYAWQVEVMINNFIEMGVNPNFIDILVYADNKIIPDQWQKLKNKYPVNFYFYTDTRNTRYYVSSIRPNILTQHFKAHPELYHDAIFYHDCDIIFTKPVQQWITYEMLNDNIWYGSDTNCYICHDYIEEKGYEVIDRMCEYAEIPRDVVKANNKNCIGAQYIMKNVGADFWAKVEKDCEKLFKKITALNQEIIIKYEEPKWLREKAEWEASHPEEVARGEVFSKPKYNPVQIWCADMWAVLWNAWKFNITTVCHPNMVFSWGTSSEEEYNLYNIMHNAGVVNTEGGLFYKTAYQLTLPYNTSLNIKPHTASKLYYDLVQRVGRKSCLL